MAENLVNNGFSVIFMRSSQHHITPQERTGKRGKCVVKMVSRGKNVVRFGQNVSEMSQKFIALFTAEFASSFFQNHKIIYINYHLC